MVACHGRIEQVAGPRAGRPRTLPRLPPRPRRRRHHGQDRRRAGRCRAARTERDVRDRAGAGAGACGPLAGGDPAIHARPRRACGAHPRAAGRPPRHSSSRERRTPAWAFRTASLPARRLPTRRWSSWRRRPDGRAAASTSRIGSWSKFASTSQRIENADYFGRHSRVVFDTGTHIELSLRNFSHGLEKFFTRPAIRLDFGVKLIGLGTARNS